MFYTRVGTVVMATIVGLFRLVDVTSDLSLYLNDDLVTAASTVLNRALATPVLQGKYWCEVWDRQTLTRKRSKTFAVRFSGMYTLTPISTHN